MHERGDVRYGQKRRQRPKVAGVQWLVIGRDVSGWAESKAEGDWQ